MGAARTLVPSALVLGFLFAPGLPAQEGKTLPAAKIVPASTQEPDEATLISRRDQKLASEFLKKADWILDYDRARSDSKKTGKVLFAYFTRSYAH